MNQHLIIVCLTLLRKGDTIFKIVDLYCGYQDKNGSVLVSGRLQKVNRLETNEVTRTLVEYERDRFGQITAANYPDGLTEQFVYDPMRRLIYAKDMA